MLTGYSGLKKSHLVVQDKYIFLLGWYGDLESLLAQGARVQVSHPLTKSLTKRRKKQPLGRQKVRASAAGIQVFFQVPDTVYNLTPARDRTTISTWPSQLREGLAIANIKAAASSTFNTLSIGSGLVPRIGPITSFSADQQSTSRSYSAMVNINFEIWNIVRNKT